MSRQAELGNLKSEEKALLHISSKLQDQLNRLKVEELALMSHIRKSEEESLDAAEKGQIQPEVAPVAKAQSELYSIDNQAHLPDLDLTIGRSQIKEISSCEEECEEEEEEEEDEGEMDDDDDEEYSGHDQLTAFLKHLEKTY